jgi:hypothetical protein
LEIVERKKMERVRRVELPTLCLASMVGKKRRADVNPAARLANIQSSKFFSVLGG